MEEKKKSGFGVGTFLLLFLSLIFILVVAYACYTLITRDSREIRVLEDQIVALTAEKELLLKQSNKTEEQKAEEKTEQKTEVKVEEQKPTETTKKEDEVPTSERVAFSCQATENGANIFYAYIENGDLYYYNEYKKADGQKDELNGSPDFSVTNYHGQVKKYEGLSNIKRLKMFNHGSGVDPMPVLITESGKVYIIYFKGGELSLNQMTSLADYEVEKLLSVPEGPWGDGYKVELKDGTITTVKP